MITDEKVEAAVDFLRTNGTKAAKAKAERIYVEEYRKVVKAQLMRERMSEPLGGQESFAYSEQRYIDHLKVVRDAIQEDTAHHWAMKAAEATLEAWRTQQANERALGKLG